MAEDAEEPKPRASGRLHARVSAAPRELMAEVPSGPGIWTARVITLFPEAFPGTLGLSLTGKALDMLGTLRTTLDSSDNYLRR